MAYQFQISANILSWPQQCACCGEEANGELHAAASRTTGKRVQNTTTKSWTVPYCKRCLHHKQQWDAASKIAGYWTAAGVLAWLVFTFISGHWFISALACVAAAIWGAREQGKAQEEARKLMCPTCSSPYDAVRYLEWHGTFHTFVFESKTYLDSFALVNSRKSMSNVREL